MASTQSPRTDCTRILHHKTEKAEAVAGKGPGTSRALATALLEGSTGGRTLKTPCNRKGPQSEAR